MQIPQIAEGRSKKHNTQPGGLRDCQTLIT